MSEDDNIKFNSSIIGDYSYLESNNKQKDLSSIIYEESVYMPLSDRFFTNSNDVSEIQRKRTHIELNEILSAAEQKERLKGQYGHYVSKEGEKRPYEQWEQMTGLPAYFRGYPFKQWADEFNQVAYTPEQREMFDRMMNQLSNTIPTSRPTIIK